MTTLTQVGVTFQLDGTLALDSTKLTKALNDNPAAWPTCSAMTTARAATATS